MNFKISYTLDGEEKTIYLSNIDKKEAESISKHLLKELYKHHNIEIKEISKIEATEKPNYDFIGIRRFSNSPTLSNQLKLFDKEKIIYVSKNQKSEIINFYLFKLNNQ